MLKDFKSIVLRTVKYSDSSIIVELLTREEGVQSFIVSGVKGGKSRHKPGFFQLGFLLDTVAYHKPGKGLSRIKEVKPYYIYTRLPYEVKRSSIAQFIIELLRHTIREPEPNEALFDFCEGALITLDRTSDPIFGLPLRFSWQLMDHLGIKSDPTGYEAAGYYDLRNGLFVSHTPDHLDYLEGKLVDSVYDLLSNENLLAPIHSLNKEDRQDLLKHTQQYYRWHIENFKTLQSPSILESVFR